MTLTQFESRSPPRAMPRILEMKEIDGKLAVFLDMPPNEVSPVHLLTDAELTAALKAEREACARFVEETYLQDDEHEEALRARFVVPEAKSGYLEAWHQPSDVADAIRNRDQL